MTMFTNIVLLDYQKPLAQRAKNRKTVGPYRWSPTQAPSNGRGFYQSSCNLSMDSRGSTLDLRLEYADELLDSWSRLKGTKYYCDNHGDETLTPIVARLPRSRGFLAGWTMGCGMCATLDAAIYNDIEEAAKAAHQLAEYDAEKERDYQAAEDERLRAEDDLESGQ